MKPKRLPYLFIAPAMVFLIVFKLYPIVYSLIGSFFEHLPMQQRAFVGLTNYERLFADKSFWQSMAATGKFNLIINPLQIVLAIGIAMLMNRPVRGIGIFRTIYFLPIAMSATVACIIWGIMYNPNNGLFNSALRAMSLPAQPFLTSADQALMCIIVLCTWRGVSYWAMFLLSGLQEISPSLYEAATIDGASAFAKFWCITLPLLKRAIAFVTVSDTIANVLLFSPSYILTGGGPRGSTNVIMYEAYKSIFGSVNLGRSYSIIGILVVLLLLVVGLQSRLLKADD